MVHRGVSSAHLWTPATHKCFEHVQNCVLATHPLPPCHAVPHTTLENPDAAPGFNQQTHIIAPDVPQMAWFFLLPFLYILGICFIVSLPFFFLFFRDADPRKGVLCPSCVPIHKKKKKKWPWPGLCRCKPTLDHPHLAEILLLAIPSSMSSGTLNRHFVETCVHPTCEQENKLNLLLYSVSHL